MRKIVFLLLLAELTPGALAAKRVNVQQVEELLAQERGQPDAKAAKMLAGLELTERASSARLARWQESFPGSETRTALLALADASAFLHLPASEIPALAAPDAATQKQIVSRMVEYVKTTVPRLPDFLAKRTTIHFDDQQQRRTRHGRHKGFLQPLIADPETPSTPGLFHAVSSTAVVVTERHGWEVAADGSGGGKSGDETDGQSDLLTAGLTTSGEFGPILAVVVGDALHSRIFWSHWEKGASGPLAVLGYAVPAENSHESVSLTPLGDEVEPQSPAYHGEIAVNPEDGTILRLTVESDTDWLGRGFQSGIAVEYGSVTIGGRPYICPVRGVALSRAAGFHGVDSAGTRIDFPAREFLNDVTFTDFHLFRAEMRVLP